jgi:hypothetical protein
MQSIRQALFIGMAVIGLVIGLVAMSTSPVAGTLSTAN